MQSLHTPCDSVRLIATAVPCPRARARNVVKIVQRGNADDGDAELVADFLDGGKGTAAALHPVQGDQHPAGLCARRTDDLHRFAHRGARGDDVVDDQDPPREAGADRSSPPRRDPWLPCG